MPWRGRLRGTRRERKELEAWVTKTKKVLRAGKVREILSELMKTLDDTPVTVVTVSLVMPNLQAVSAGFVVIQLIVMAVGSRPCAIWICWTSYPS